MRAKKRMLEDTSVIQAKDDHIADLQSQIDGHATDRAKLIMIILATQRDNQLLIEAKSRRWWFLEIIQRDQI